MRTLILITVAILMVALVFGVLGCTKTVYVNVTPTPTPTTITTPTPKPTSTPTPTPALVHYINEEFGYSIDYPKNWVFGQISPNEIGIGPKDSQYEQIQIGAFPGQPVLGSLSQSLAEKLNAAALQQWFDALGARNLNIIQNEPAQGKWDWMMVFTVIYEDTPLMGSYLIKETQSTTYTLVYLQVTGIDWPEGMDALDSFMLLSE